MGIREGVVLGVCVSNSVGTLPLRVELWTILRRRDVFVFNSRLSWDLKGFGVHCHGSNERRDCVRELLVISNT